MGLVDWERYGQDNVIFSAAKAGGELLAHHKQVLEQLVARDKHHPSVVLWSAANEAATYETGAENYFKEISAHLRGLDPSRPIMIVENAAYHATRAARFFDIIGVNRYYGWYSDPGRLEHIWNFADFMTPQEVRRVMGNRKGVFTRQRQPKMAAHFLKRRWQNKASFTGR
jgi:beta-glucuronidase